jgi:hypothetical protein
MSNENEVLDEVEATDDDADLPAGFFNVSMKDTKMKVEVKFPFDFKATTAEAVEAYGEEAVHKAYVSGAKLRANAVLRGLIKSGKSPEDAVKIMSTEWRPGVSMADPYAAVKKRLEALPAEERQAEIQRMLAEMGLA